MSCPSTHPRRSGKQKAVHTPVRLYAPGEAAVEARTTSFGATRT